MDVTLDDVIRGYLVSLGKNTLHGYLRLMKFAMDFLKQLSLDAPFLDKTVQLRLDEKKSLQWPDDCVMWSKLGITIGDRVFVFERDSTISLFHDTTNDNPSQTANGSWDGITLPLSGTVQLNNFWYGDQCGYISGLRVKRGFNYTGYFNVNWRDKEFQFSSDVPSDTNIYLTYKTNGFVLKTRSVIPEFAAILAERYIHWQSALFDKRYGAASVETQGRKLAYDQAYMELVSRVTPVSYSDITGALARSTDQNKFVR